MIFKYELQFALCEELGISSYFLVYRVLGLLVDLHKVYASFVRFECSTVLFPAGAVDRVTPQNDAVLAVVVRSPYDDEEEEEHKAGRNPHLRTARKPRKKMLSSMIMGSNSNSGSTMMIMMMMAVCCCCVLSVGGIAGMYFFYEPFKKWVNKLLNIDNGPLSNEELLQQFIDAGCENKWLTRVEEPIGSGNWTCPTNLPGAGGATKARDTGRNASNTTTDLKVKGYFPTVGANGKLLWNKPAEVTKDLSTVQCIRGCGVACTKCLDIAKQFHL